MSRQLTEAMREATAQVPGYDVADAAIRLGRRRRAVVLTSSLAAAVAMLGLLGLGLAPLLVNQRQGPAEQAPPSPSLPDRVGPAPAFVQGLADQPHGPAAVILSERSGPFTGGRLIAVGATSDTYRAVANTEADPGRAALLSPDGSAVVYPSGKQLFLANLTAGTLRGIPSPDPAADEVRPAVWMPDGRGLIVLTITYAKDPTTQGTAKRLGILDLDTGAYQRFAEATWPIGPAGFAVAVSPDGGRIAYQYQDFITVYDRATNAKHKITLPDWRTVLAGKGAWSPDGRSLVVVHRDTDHYNDRRWQLRLLDPQTGTERDPTYRPWLADMSIVRLLGWDGITGEPVVAGYQADYTPDGFLDYTADLMRPATVHSVGVYELGVDGFRVLLNPSNDLTGIDIAQSIISTGRTRYGHPPNTLGPVEWTALGLFGLGLVWLTGRWLLRRRAVRKLLLLDLTWRPEPSKQD